MNEQISTVTPFSQRSDTPAEGVERVENNAQPKRLLGELSRASQSLAEVLDSLTAEKSEVEARLATVERELERARAEAATAKSAASAEAERARDEIAGQLASSARAAARNQARAERAERLLAVVGGLRESTSFCVTVSRRARRRASREMLAQAVTDGVHLRLSAHEGWRNTLLVADVEGDQAALRQFLVWARDRFAADEFRERQT
jgi:alanyl-tRNA synthetase